jgi:copper chaperone
MRIFASGWFFMFQVTRRLLGGPQSRESPCGAQPILQSGECRIGAPRESHFARQIRAMPRFFKAPWPLRDPRLLGLAPAGAYLEARGRSATSRDGRLVSEKEHVMSEGAPDVVLAVQGMTCGGCATAVTRVVKKIDPQAEVSVDLPNARVNARTSADPHGLAEAITKAGYEAVPLA